MKHEFDDQELLRYSRHILLPEMDVAGQLALANSRVLIIGLGGLGSPVAMYLAASGVGHLTLVDDDRVELGNLQRQIVHSEATVGVNKSESAAAGLRQLNSRVHTTVIDQRLDDRALQQQVTQADLVLDCSDNFPTRRAVNSACVATQTPLVSAAAIRLEGQLAVFDSRDPQSPCYQCLYPELDDEQLSCSESGILAPVVGIMGSLQALEALKLLSGMGQPQHGRLLIFDALRTQFREFKLARDPACKVCGPARAAG